MKADEINDVIDDYIRRAIPDIARKCGVMEDHVIQRIQVLFA